MNRRATWECRACPDHDQVLRPYVPHYATKADAEAGLRRHFLAAHAELLWLNAELVSGDVIDFVPAA